MNSIGGYFELELPHGEEYHKNAIRLNTGRNAFEYVLRAKAYQKVYLPYYTCDVMLEPIQKLNLGYKFYSIDEFLQPIFDFSIIKDDEVFVYNNYFGICDNQVNEVAAKCKNLIVDNSQAFYSLPLPGVDTFYSPRKFFGIPDGAYLYTDTLLDDSFETDISYRRFEHLLGRADKGAEEFYTVFRKNEEELSNQPIKQMSRLTQKLLSGIDYNAIADIRRQNFHIFHSHLKEINKLKVNLELGAVPMTYPLMVSNGEQLKQKLIQNKVFLATYWPNVKNWVSRNSIELKLYSNLLSIPIDQRYSHIDMKKILLILNYV
jgi:hypothetical protein